MILCSGPTWLTADCDMSCCGAVPWLCCKWAEALLRIQDMGAAASHWWLHCEQ